MNTTQLDAFGTPVEVGDIVLGATPRKNNYQDTTYCFSVVISKTKGMLRLHQLGSDPKVQHHSRDLILESVEGRRGRRGGAIASLNVINIGVNTGITEKEFADVNKPSTTAANVPMKPFRLKPPKRSLPTMQSISQSTLNLKGNP